MAVVAGPTQWWYNSDQYYACFAKCNDVGSTTFDGSRLICKAGGIGWFVAPSSTQVIGPWAGGQYNSTEVEDKCCISEWSALQTTLENRSRPIDSTKWFVPSITQLNNPGYVCRTNWDSFDAATIGLLRRAMLRLRAASTLPMVISATSLRRSLTGFVPSGV
jgi:hypothetical protein